MLRHSPDKNSVTNGSLGRNSRKNPKVHNTSDIFSQSFIVPIRNCSNYAVISLTSSPLINLLIEIPNFQLVSDLHNRRHICLYHQETRTVYLPTRHRKLYWVARERRVANSQTNPVRIFPRLSRGNTYVRFFRLNERAADSWARIVNTRGSNHMSGWRKWNFMVKDKCARETRAAILHFVGGSSLFILLLRVSSLQNFSRFTSRYVSYDKSAIK